MKIFNICDQNILYNTRIVINFLIELNKKNRINGEIYKKVMFDQRQQSQFNIM